LITECKVAAEELLKDVQGNKSTKVFPEMDLLICITFDDQQIVNQGGAIHPVTDAAREYSGVTHKLLHGNHEVQVICLKTIIDTLEANGVI